MWFNPRYQAAGTRTAEHHEERNGAKVAPAGGRAPRHATVLDRVIQHDRGIDSHNRIVSAFDYDHYLEQTTADMEQLLSAAEAKWSLQDDEGAAADLVRALETVWGRPDDVSRVADAATRLAVARPSEALSAVARRAAESAEALDISPVRSSAVEDAPPKSRRRHLARIQLAVFSLVVLAVLVVQYLEAVR